MNISAPSVSRFGRLVRAIKVLRLPRVVLALIGLAFTVHVIAGQMSDRTEFANTDLATEVEARWGAPVTQPAPSLRYVQSGSVFTELKAAPFDRQNVEIDAAMNYRKRGLRYFSGFDFKLSAQYVATNREAHDIDVAFIFPVTVDKSRALLSELEFMVDGVGAPLDLGPSGDRLVWTGRIPRGKSSEFTIRYRARGLDQFEYLLDPALPAKDARLRIAVTGGRNHDYPEGVLSANVVTQTPDGVTLDWSFASLESGVGLGVTLPSEKKFDGVVEEMALNAWVPFLAFAAALWFLGLRRRKQLAAFEFYLLAATFGITFVLLAYLAAHMHFYVAYAITMVGLGAVMTLYTRRLFPSERWTTLVGIWCATQVIPTFAVILEDHTGLIFTLEILAALVWVMALSLRASTRSLFAAAFAEAPLQTVVVPSTDGDR